MVLPARTAIDLPYVPAMDKVLIPNLVAILLCRFTVGHKLHYLPINRLSRFLIILFILSPFLTALTNNAPIVIGDRILPAITLYDAVSLLLRQMIFISPFIIGRLFLATEEAHRTLLVVLVVAGLIYSLPMLFEVRMSPQLHTWIYGFFPHSFAQQYRYGGFRPVVFMGHGLLVAFFAMTSVVAATALWRMRQRIAPISTGLITMYLAIVLILCKSVAALLYGAMAFFLVRFTSTQMQMRIAAVLVLVALCYPALRGVGLVPVQTAVSMAEIISTDRAASLNVRLNNEARLLAHANEKPLFGWGSWGRNRLHDVNSARDISITDGRWIITMGVFGWSGYFAEFGLLVLPVLMVLRINRRKGFAIPSATAALGLIYAVNIFDLLPNASLTPWTWLVSGALLGFAEKWQVNHEVQFIEAKSYPGN